MEQEESERKIDLRALESLDGWRGVRAIVDMTEVANYRIPDQNKREELTAGKGKSENLIYKNNREVWRSILDGVEATENRRVELHGFWLTEWLPLRPGLFHTRNARVARNIALRESRILLEDETVPLPLRSMLSDMQGRRNQVQLFNPYGKSSMVDGGIGCVRLKPMPNRRSHRWAFGASSSGVVHEGVPIALDDSERDSLISDIRRFGGLLCTIHGTLRYVPRDDYTEVMFGRGIPQLYIEVDKISPEPARRSTRKRLNVTAAVTFLSRSERYPGVNVSYVTFDPGHNGDLAAAAEWLDDIYIRQSYQGRILTDFDEQTRHFEQASFSLNKLLNGLVSKSEAREIDNEFQVDGRLVEALDRRMVFVAGDVYGDIYLARHVAAMGPNANATNTRFTFDKKDSHE